MRFSRLTAFLYSTLRVMRTINRRCFTDRKPGLSILGIFPGVGVPKSVVMIPSLVTSAPGSDFLNFLYCFDYFLDYILVFFCDGLTFYVFLIQNFYVKHVAGLAPSSHWRRSGQLGVLTTMSSHLTLVQVHFLVASRVLTLLHGVVSSVIIIVSHSSESPMARPNHEVLQALAGVGIIIIIPPCSESPHHFLRPIKHLLEWAVFLTVFDSMYGM